MIIIQRLMGNLKSIFLSERIQKFIFHLKSSTGAGEDDGSGRKKERLVTQFSKHKHFSNIVINKISQSSSLVSWLKKFI